VGIEKIRLNYLIRRQLRYNHDRPPMSLDWERQETPAQAFARKMPPEGQAVVDELTGEEYHAG